MLGLLSSDLVSEESEAKPCPEHEKVWLILSMSNRFEHSEALATTDEP